jgi:hypothetical protein
MAHKRGDIITPLKPGNITLILKTASTLDAVHKHIILNMTTPGHLVEHDKTHTRLQNNLTSHLVGNIKPK